ncbi:hypothetical protein M3223_02115 [Paenibacillus pasadenensis]|uniref:hypothetical protein n=1 Tax=Paenibacillus pasadenensis TaxID=217090 RepID=UPI00203ADE70|nr:hypothetical protein [Paenibacillus pasadenensis]MCM3746144.1 hypothetical protein [Paenibacillus pasadenensis]
MINKLMRLYRVLVFTAIVITVILIPDIYHYYTIRVSTGDAAKFEERLLEKAKRNEPMRLAELTSFQWDRMIIMEPYMSQKLMEELAGAKWTTAKSYAGYRVNKAVSDSCAVCDDSLHKLVFVKGNRVMADVTLSRSDLDFLDFLDVLDVQSVFRDQDPIFAKQSPNVSKVKLISPFDRDEE